MENLLIGLASSVIAAFVILLGQFLYSKFIFRKTYFHLSGEYDGYGYSEEDITILNTSKTQSHAEIKYIGRNKLRIKVCHGRIWDGDLIMETENYGTIVWKYKPDNKDEHNFGFKRCFVRRDTEENKIYLYLVGESNLDGAYKELLDGNNKELLKRILKPNREVFIKIASR